MCRPSLLLALLVASPAPAQTALYTIQGEQPGLSLGTRVVSPGDVDGDGFDDLLVAAAGLQATTPPGRVRLYSGASGALVYEVIGPPQGVVFGLELATIGDVDLDGRIDFAVGEPHAQMPGYVGYVRVFSGTDGTLLYEVPGTPTYSAFAVGLDGIGDVDADGWPDFLIGSHSDAISPSFGSARVISGRDGALLHLYVNESGSGGIGTAVAGLGDVDLDGRPDFAVSSSSFAGDLFQAGHVRIYSGATFAVLRDISGPIANGRFGFSLAGAGDVDGDGSGDLFIGAPGVSGDGLRGRAYVCSGATGALFHTFVGDAWNDRLGWRVFSIGDFDQDGISEMAVSAAPHSISVAEYIDVYSPTTGTKLFTIREPFDFNDSEWPSTAVGLGDLDGDGKRELAIGFPWHAGNGAAAGRVRVLNDPFPKPVGSLSCFGDGSVGACPCANTGASGTGCANSTGAGVRLEAFGSRSVVEDTLFLTGSRAPASVLTILFMGDDTTGPTSAVAGDGLRCIAGSLQRVLVRNTNENGDIWYGPEIGSIGGWAAGDRRHFQAYYRNPPGPCGSGFNASNALTILFTP